MTSRGGDAAYGSLSSWRGIFKILGPPLGASGVAAAAAATVAEMAVGGRGVASGPGHSHFHRVQGAVHVDVLGLGWRMFGGTFTSL